MDTRTAFTQYIAIGLAVIPLKPGLKEPLFGQGAKHACTDVATMEGYLQAVPDMNLGIVMGASRIFVLDVDPRNGGFETMRKLEAEALCLTPTLTASTGQNGLHFYYQDDPDTSVPIRKEFLPGLDIKAGVGYVVAPPSRLVETEKHTAGGYEWVATDTGITTPPKWLLKKAAKREKTLKDVQREVRTMGPSRYAQSLGGMTRVEAQFRGRVQSIASMGEGRRNDQLSGCAYYAARDVMRGVLSEDLVKQELYQAARGCGLDHEESVKTIQSGFDGAKRDFGVT